MNNVWKAFISILCVGLASSAAWPWSPANEEATTAKAVMTNNVRVNAQHVAAPHTDDTMKAVFLRRYVLPVSNRNRRNVGYEGDVSGAFGKGPNGMALMGDYLFIADGYHNCVKRIDLENGKAINSTFTFPEFTPPVNDVAAWQNTLYVSNVTDTLYVMTPAMKVMRRIILPTNYWRTQQYFLGRLGTSPELYSPISSFIAKVTGDSISMIEARDKKSRPDLTYARETTATPNSDSTRWFLRIASGRVLEFDKQLPDLTPYWAMNTAYDSTRFAVFTVNPKKFTVDVFSYK